MHCAACRRPLTNPVSIQYGMGPDCLRRAVKAGTAPIEALSELTEWRSSKKRQPITEAAPIRDELTMDLFEQLRAAALDDLSKAVTACGTVGIKITFKIEE